MRHVFLPIAGDPFIFNYWLQNYLKFVAPKVDGLYVGQSGPADPEGLEIIQELCDLHNIKVDFKYSGGFDAGLSLEVAYELLDEPGKPEDVVLLIESDCFVFDPSILDQYFNMVEDNQYRLIGSDRVQSWTDITPGSPEVKTPRVESGMWPCFLFTNAKDFHQTYEEMKFHLSLPGLADPNYVFNNKRGSEESVSFTILLKSKTGPHHEIAQIRGDHITSYQAGQYPAVPWLHIGSLECLSLPYNIFRDLNNKPVLVSPDEEWPLTPLADHPSAHLQGMLYIGLYKACVELKTIGDHKRMVDRHLESIQQAIETFNYNAGEIDHYCNVFLSWV